jgi:hypothetical protein
MFERLHVFRANGEVKIGVIDVWEHGLATDAALGQHGIDVAL